MKKKLSLVAAGALMLTMSFSMAGCTDDKIKKLAPEFEGKFSTQVVENIMALNSGTNYSFGESDDTGLVVIYNTTVSALTGLTSTTYQLFDLTTQQLIPGATSTNEIKCLDDGLFYSVTTPVAGSNIEPAYTLYTRAGMQNHPSGSVDESNGVFTATNSGTPVRYYVDIDGNIQTESDPFKELFTKKHSKSCAKIGKYYMSLNASSSSNNSYNFTVYNNKGKKIRNFSTNLRLGTSSNSQLEGAWFIDNKLFMQIVTSLPDSVDAYDFYQEDTKYDIVTYSYDLKEDKVSKVKNFDYVVSDVEMLNEDNVILKVQEIKNKQIIDQSFIQAFDKKGKVSIDLQKLVPGAVEYGYDPISKCSYLTDAYGYQHIYDGNKLIRTLDDGFRVLGDRIIRSTRTTDETFGSLTTLIIYDAKDSSVNKTISNIVEYDITESNDICYRSNNNQIYLLDIETMGEPVFKASFNEATDYSLDFEDQYFTIYGNQGTSIYFMDSAVNVPQIIFNGDVSTRSYYVENTCYEILKCEQENLVTGASSYTYKMIISTTPYSELFF